MCKTQLDKNVERQGNMSDSSENSSNFYDKASQSSDIGEIKNVNMISRPWLVDIKVFDETISFKIDSGETIITSQTYKGLCGCDQNLQLRRTTTTLVGPGKGDKAELTVKGKVKVPMEWKGKKMVKVFVIRTAEDLLGRPALKVLNMMK